MALCPLTVGVAGCSWSFPYFGGFNHYCDDVIQYLLSWLCRQRNFCGQSERAVASEVKPGISMLNFRSHPGNPKFRDQPPFGKVKWRCVCYILPGQHLLFSIPLVRCQERDATGEGAGHCLIFTGGFHGFSFTQKTRRRQYL